MEQSQQLMHKKTERYLANMLYVGLLYFTSALPQYHLFKSIWFDAEDTCSRVDGRSFFTSVSEVHKCHTKAKRKPIQ